MFTSEGSARLGDALVLRKGANSLNVLRLVLACLVIASHSITLGGFGTENILGRNGIGAVSVDGFFGISGYLICASALRHTNRSGRWPGIRRYFWDRFLRIFPGFWVCLIVTAFGFGVFGWLSTHNTLAGYWRHPVGPLYYLTSNFYLTTPTYQISGTPSAIPYPLVWDGSLWTLEWEFLCYIGVGALAAVGLLIRRFAVLWMALFAWLLGIIIFFHPLPSHPSAEVALRFVPIFLTGALMYLFRNEIPDSGLLAIGLTALAAFGLMFGHPGQANQDWLTGPYTLYAILWVGAHLPLRRIGATNDISYGMYIYGFLVGQTLAIEGFQRYGYWPYMVVTVVCTVPLALASWWGVKMGLQARSWKPSIRSKASIE